MRFWPASLQSRLMALLFLALLLANTLTLSLLFYERMSSARSVMLGNLASDVATSVAILDRLPAAERPQWLPKLARGNYRYLLDAGERGDYPDSWRARDAARSLQEALSAQYPVSIVAIPGPRQHIQAHITLHDGAPLTLDLWPKLPAIAGGADRSVCPPAGLRLVRGSPGIAAHLPLYPRGKCPGAGQRHGGNYGRAGAGGGASRRPRV